MTRRILSSVLLTVLLLAVLAPSLAGDMQQGSMYVNTANGKALRFRSSKSTAADNVLAEIPYGTKVYVLDWDGIKWRPLGFGGVGGAIDLGVKYEINDYINVSASVNDLGFIVWKNKVNAINAGKTYIIQIDDIDSEEGSILDVVNDVIDKFKSVYEFYPEKNNYSTQLLSINANLGAEFKMPFYRKMSVGILATTRNSHVNRYNEVRMSLNAAPLKWLSFSLSTAYTTFGWEVGGMVNVYAKKFSAYLGTDSYYFNMNSQFLPIHEANAHVVFGVNYLLTRNPFKRHRR